jgi:hypothetical protein
MEDGAILGENLANLFVEDCLIVELKAFKSLANEHMAQLPGYLQACGTNTASRSISGHPNSIFASMLSPNLNLRLLRLFAAMFVHGRHGPPVGGTGRQRQIKLASGLFNGDTCRTTSFGAFGSFLSKTFTRNTPACFRSGGRASAGLSAIQDAFEPRGESLQGSAYLKNDTSGAEFPLS